MSKKNNSLKIELEQLCETLKLRGMAIELNSAMMEAEKMPISLASSVMQLLTAEYKYRQERSMLNRIKSAKLPWDWSLTTFPFDQQPSINKQQILNLAGLDFINRAENIVFIGDPGTGKSGLAMGILREALINGYRGQFYNAQDLLDELYASLADRTTSKLLTKLSRFPILMIDELGYLTLNAQQVNAFFKLMDMRYGRTATIITTNLAFDQWYDLFKNKPLVDALLDRLQHRCINITITGPSLRRLATPDDGSSSDDSANTSTPTTEAEGLTSSKKNPAATSKSEPTDTVKA